MKRIIAGMGDVCRRSPLLPIVVISALPLALLGAWRPWAPSGADAGGITIGAWSAAMPGVGQWIAIVLVLAVVVRTLVGIVADLRDGRVGVDLLAVIAMLSTVVVQEYWAAWAVVLMVASGEVIESYAQAKAEESLTQVMASAPRTAHVSTLPGVNEPHSNDAAPGSATGIAAARAGDRFRRIDAAPTRWDGGEGLSPKGARLAGAGVENGAEPHSAGASAGVGPHPAARPDHYRTVPVEEVHVGDVLCVLPGETVPVDGELVSGEATLDLSAINGEPLPRTVFAGARVVSGAVNGGGVMVMRSTSRPEDSQYQRIVSLVSEARDSRPRAVTTADRLAVPFTILSLAIAGAAWALSGSPLRFAQVLVLATPCPLLIAAPVAYVAATGCLARNSIVVKRQDVLETLGGVRHVFFDKTGTLTSKRPRVVRVEPAGDPAALAARATAGAAGGASDVEEVFTDHILMMAGVVESYSTHVLSNGITQAGREALGRLQGRFAASGAPHPGGEPQGLRAGFPVVEGVNEQAGMGICGTVNGHDVAVGRRTFVAGGAAEPALPSLGADEMGVWVSVDGTLCARIVLRDVPRPEAAPSVEAIRRMGIDHITMLTGDAPSSAAVVARETGIDDVRASLLPEGKFTAVRESGERPTMMVGDGINDAPVLAAADVGVAMTDGTSSAASESAQLVVMNDSIAAVPLALSVARRTRTVMLQAVLGGLGLATVLMVAAAFGAIPVVAGAFIQEGIDVVSILWALTALHADRPARRRAKRNVVRLQSVVRRQVPAEREA